MKKIQIVLAVLGSFVISNVEAQYLAQDNRTAAQLIEKLVKGNVTIINPVLDCTPQGNLTYVQTGPDHVPDVDTGIVLGTTRMTNVLNNTGSNSYIMHESIYWRRDEDVNDIYRSWGVDTLINSFHTCKLTFDMIPHTDTVKIDYIVKGMGATGYTSVLKTAVRYGCRPATDMYVILVSGGTEAYSKKNFAVIPGTEVPANIYTIYIMERDSFPTCRDGMMEGWENVPYTEYFRLINDITDSSSMFYHKFGNSSVPMEAVIPTTPCDTYSVKLACSMGFFYKTEDDYPGEIPPWVDVTPPNPEFTQYNGWGCNFFLSNLRGVGTVYECATGDTSTAITTQQEYAALSIYPNPAATSIQVDVSKVSYSSGTILIYDMMGKEVYTETLIDKKDKLEISVKDLLPGVYTLMLHTDKGNYLSKFTKEK